MTKSELRKEYLNRRKDLLQTEIEDAGRRIANRLFMLTDPLQIAYLHIFLTIRENAEIDTDPVISTFRRDRPEVKVCVPRIDANGNTLECVELQSDTMLRPNRWGIPEPIDGVLRSGKVIDVVIVPLLVFDRHGHRVGYGGGYYDRFLADCRPDCLKIGVSVFDPVDEIAGITAADVALDHCVTPGKIWSFG